MLIFFFFWHGFYEFDQLFDGSGVLFSLYLKPFFFFFLMVAQLGYFFSFNLKLLRLLM